MGIMCLFVISYITVLLIIGKKTMSTAEINIFSAESCQYKNKLGTAFKYLFYEFYTNDPIIFQLPDSTTFEGMLQSALEYPKFFTDKTNEWNFYFGDYEHHFATLLNGNFCSNSISNPSNYSLTFSRYVCDNFAGKTAQEGILAYWYYEIDTLRSIYFDLIDKKLKLSAADYVKYKHGVWNDRTFFE